MDKRLNIIDAHELMERNLPPPLFCVDSLLPQGLSILGGAPKIGKSWLVLDLCVRVAKGQPIWNLPTRQSAVLYLCIDTFQMARGGNGDVSYAGDYEDMRRFKELADGLGIAPSLENTTASTGKVLKKSHRPAII